MPAMMREKTVQVEITEKDLLDYLEQHADPISRVVLVNKGLRSLTEADLDKLRDFFDQHPDQLEIIEFMARSKAELEAMLARHKVIEHREDPWHPIEEGG